MLIILSGSLSGVNYRTNQSRPRTMSWCILQKYNSSLCLILERYSRFRVMIRHKGAYRSSSDYFPIGTVLDTTRPILKPTKAYDLKL